MKGAPDVYSLKRLVYRGVPHSHVNYKIEEREGLLFAIVRFYCNTIGEVAILY
jgi:hypothetical protein